MCKKNVEHCLKEEFQATIIQRASTEFRLLLIISILRENKISYSINLYSNSMRRARDNKFI